MYLGVLQLSNNKTYGRARSESANIKEGRKLTKPGKLLYKCIPDDKNIAPVLIPYEIKPGFSKKISNRFIVFKFDDKQKQAILLETIGEVNDLAAFFSYRLKCRGLYSPKFILDHLEQQIEDSWITTLGHEDRQHELVYTIDPYGCTDFDDAFSVEKINDGEKISIYISNVAGWIMQLDTSMQKNDIFAQIQRVSTIYFPTGKLPMLPPILSEHHCSLKAGGMKLVLAMDCYSKKPHIEFKLAVIRVRENFVYESARCLACPAYKMLLDTTRNIANNPISDSHDVIEYWMVRMNQECGKKLAEKNTGIFRTSSVTETGSLVPANIRDGLAAFRRHNPDGTLAAFRRHNPDRTLAAYSLFETIEHVHEQMNVTNYAHITSPIRRLVDLLNQLMFLRDCMNIPLTKSATELLDRFQQPDSMTLLNEKMRNTRKYQLECELMHRCLNLDPSIFQQGFSGWVFDVDVNAQEYMVYIADLKLFARVKMEEDDLHSICNYSKHQFRIYMFEDESTVYRKIRVQRIL
jgi:exoribonuclease R